MRDTEFDQLKYSVSSTTSPRARWVSNWAKRNVSQAARSICAACVAEGLPPTYSTNLARVCLSNLETSKNLVILAGS